MAATAFFFSPKHHETKPLGFDEMSQQYNTSGLTLANLCLMLENRSSNEQAHGLRQPQEIPKTNGPCD
jgi:hypothetical protein